VKIKTSPENILERIALTFNLAPLPLVDTQVAFNSARAIMAGADLGIYDAIGKGIKTAREISSACKTDVHATTHLLNCLVGIGYLKWNDNKYALKPRYYKWLLSEYESNLIGKLRFQKLEWEWMSNLEEFVKSGKPMDFHYHMSASDWASYQEGMRDLSINSAKELAKKIKLPPGATKMLDIGGSHGLYSIELCKKNPAVSSTILELPGAIDRASEIAARHGLSDKVKYQAGNALTDDLGKEQYDFIMINNVVHHFTSEQNYQLAKKIAAALKPGGIYAIGEFSRMNKPGQGGAVGATAGLYFAMTSSSGTWSIQEMNDWQTAAGLKPRKPITVLTLPGWLMLMAEKQ
jgi:2-polyprenyl-3-methyl-5-hydroxy-6-metoxy-1,4-benzoquinol methylase